MQLEDNFKTYQKVKKRQQKRTFPVNVQEGYCQNDSLFGQLDFSLPISEASLTPILNHIDMILRWIEKTVGFLLKNKKRRNEK